MDVPEAYRERIARIAPDLRVRSAELVTEGRSNVVIMVNDRWVFRFAKSEAAAADLRREAKVLQLAKRHVDLAVPHVEAADDGYMLQRKARGGPLDRHTLLRQPPPVQERLVSELARFLYQLHRVPVGQLQQAGVGPSPASQGRLDAGKLFGKCEQELFPHLKESARASIREHFDPVLAGRLSLDYEPVLIHGDLSPSHVLWDRDAGRLAAVIDFGMAGLGDSSLDYATIIQTYGETPLRRMHAHHPTIGHKIDRARFWALALELQWALAGLASGDPAWHCAHLGLARDASPIGTPWEEA